MLAPINPNIPEIKNLTYGLQFRHVKLLAVYQFRVNASNQSVYTGGLRPGGLLPLRTVAGGVGASLQGNRKQVESRE